MRMRFVVLGFALCTVLAFAVPFTATADCVPPPQGMAAWWPLDDSGTLWYTNLRAGPQAWKVGNATTVPGEVAGAVRCPTSTDYLWVQSVSCLNFGIGSFSVDAWIRTSDTNEADRTIVDKRGGTSAFPQGYALSLHQGLLCFQVGDGTAFSGNHLSSGPVLTNGAWYHVAATVDRSGPTGVVKLYVDGAVTPLSTANPVKMGSVSSDTVLTIGQRGFNFGHENAFNGDIDEVELFGRVLAAGEISSIYNAGPAGKCKYPLPSVGAWGMMILTLILGLSGAFFVYRQRTRRAT